MRYIFLLPLLTLTACYTPTVSQNPAQMSAQTLCFRAETHPEDAALRKEIAARNLDCAGLLRDDPLVPGGPELDAAHRIGH